jgi:hypothetical protein
VPLAPLCLLPENVPVEEALASVIRRLVERVQKEATPDEVRRLLTATYLLTGLRLKRDRARAIFMGISAMHESDTYLAILEEGAVRVLRRVLLRLGEKFLGPADEAVRTSVAGIESVEVLEGLLDRVSESTSWQQLLGTLRS